MEVCHSHLKRGKKQEYLLSSFFSDTFWEVSANTRMRLRELNRISILIKRKQADHEV